MQHIWMNGTVYQVLYNNHQECIHLAPWIMFMPKRDEIHNHKPYSLTATKTIIPSKKFGGLSLVVISLNCMTGKERLPYLATLQGFMTRFSFVH